MAYAEYLLGSYIAADQANGVSNGLSGGLKFGIFQEGIGEGYEGEFPGFAVDDE